VDGTGLAVIVLVMGCTASIGAIWHRRARAIALAALSLCLLAGCPPDGEDPLEPREPRDPMQPVTGTAGSVAPVPIGAAGATAPVPMVDVIPGDGPWPDAWPVPVGGTRDAPTAFAPEPSRPGDVGIGYCPVGCVLGDEYQLGGCNSPGGTTLQQLDEPDPELGGPEQFATCAVYVVPGTRVRIEASASQGYVFDHWTAGANASEGLPCGCEDSTEAVCETVVEEPSYCGAVFAPAR
jgi:hypothetical protein